MNVLICGGGTGGHIYPALAAVAELQQRGVEAQQILWIGTRGQMEEELVPRAGLRLETIRGGPIVGVPLGQRMQNAAKLGLSILTVERLMSQFQPSVLFMTGGYVNAPVGLVGRRRGIPAGIYLPDVEPGSTIKSLSRLVNKVATTTTGSNSYFPEGKTVLTGYPVRPELRSASKLTKADALAQFDLQAERPTLFVFGGSRGARSINRALLGVLDQLLTSIQIIHISGKLDWEEVSAAAAQLSPEQAGYYRPFPYLHSEMGPAFRAADLVVARAGASMLGEAPAFGLPTILVPYPHAWRYQKVNADFLAANGAAIRLNDENLTTDLFSTVHTIIHDREKLAAMASAAASLDVPDAAGRLADFILKLGEGKIA